VPGKVGHPALPPENRALGDINNPLATGYAVQASIQRDTLLWSFKKLEMSVILFCIRAIFKKVLTFCATQPRSISLSI
jgi:hypothetical protein